MTRDTRTVKRFGNKDFIFTTIVAIVIAGLAIGAAVYLKAHAPSDDGSYVPGHTEITPDIELLRDYVMIDTTSGHEIDGAKFLKAALDERGVASEVIESVPGKASVYARIKGREPGGALMLLNHIDVVPANPDEWSYAPFGGEIALDRLWGRGTLDMKGTAITELLAFADVARSGRVPAHDLIFLAVADEESLGRLGLKWLHEHRPDIFEGLRFVINEGGLTETVRDKLVYFAVETGSKNIIQFTASGPDENGLEAFRQKLLAFGIEPRIERLLPGVDEYFRAIAPRRRVGGEILADVQKGADEGRMDELGSNYLELLQNYAIVREDVVRDGDEFRLRAFLSLLPDEDPQRWVQRLREWLPPGARLDVQFMTFPAPSPLSSTDTELFRELTRQAKAMWGNQTQVGPHVMAAQTTDCRFLRSEAVDCYGIWPFQVTFFESQGVHHADERLRLSWFVEGVTFMRRLVRGYLELPAEE